ncbi:MAG: hypothetical protein ACAI43_01470 [Phycisphaerae bacterium]|nr:hypothetical protein [Tepidisphaeraceae bacterium]
MTDQFSYVVSWVRGTGPGERRTIADRAEALDFYGGLTADPKVEWARVVEVAEREVRFFEREPHTARRGGV